MTMPSDPAGAAESGGSNDGPRERSADVDVDHIAYVDDDNVPHPGHDNETG